jgi:dihydroxyacid dehydratase/phosphogluconate dehydratase
LLAIAGCDKSIPGMLLAPQIADMKPAGRFMMKDLHAAGGVPAVMHELLAGGLLNGQARTITGRTIAEDWRLWRRPRLTPCSDQWPSPSSRAAAMPC